MSYKLLGTESWCHQLPPQGTVSAHHAMIFLEQGSFYITVPQQKKFLECFNHDKWDFIMNNWEWTSTIKNWVQAPKPGV
jgi:hypothetical protein